MLYFFQKMTVYSTFQLCPSYSLVSREVEYNILKILQVDCWKQLCWNLSISWLTLSLQLLDFKNRAERCSVLGQSISEHWSICHSNIMKPWVQPFVRNGKSAAVISWLTALFLTAGSRMQDTDAEAATPEATSVNPYQGAPWSPLRQDVRC